MPVIDRLRASPAIRYAALVALVVLYACLFQGMRPLYSPDEGRYTDVALAMLDSGDWIHPKLHHEVEHWSKPPMTYWAIAASLATFGRSEFAARLPGALAFAGTILLLLRLGRRFVPERAWLPPLVYATFAFPSIAANLVTTDSLLAFAETLVVAAFLAARDAGDGAASRRRAGFALGACTALAFMTKGPPGLLSLAACLAFVAWNDGRPGFRRLPLLPALAAFAVLGLGWYAFVVMQEPGVLRYFLVEEVVNRVASDKLHRNAEWYGAFKIYLPTLALGTLPWMPVLAMAAWRTRRNRFASLRDSETARLLLCWIALPAFVFFLSRSRLPLYVLPLFAPLAVVVARVLPARIAGGWRVALAVWAVLLLGARIVPARLDADGDDRRLAREIAAALDRPPSEVAFVETAPRFGLRFYLGAEIERLNLPFDDPRPQTQDLASELTEREGCRLLLVERDRAVELQAALADHGVRSFVVPQLRGYVGIAQLSDDCAWSGRQPAMPG